MEAGNKTQQLKAKATNMMTWVHHGVKKRLVTWEIDDQSKERFRNPMPPNPAPMKFAVGLLGATQHKKAMDPSMGKAYSGRNCHRITPSRTRKKTLICFRDSLVGFSRSFFWVSKSAVWQILVGFQLAFGAGLEVQLCIGNLRLEPVEISSVGVMEQSKREV